MALLLSGRLLPVLRPTRNLATPLLLATFSTTRTLADFPSKPLPDLPPKETNTQSQQPQQPQQTEQDVFARRRREFKPESQRYDATKSSLSQIIGADMTTAFLNRSADGFESLHPRAPQIPVRLVPSTGRTVHVNGPVTVKRAFQQVGQRVQNNNVPALFHRQRFHERNGLKRKRLKMSRWRTRFKTGFNATVVRVQELVRQGW